MFNRSNAGKWCEGCSFPETRRHLAFSCQFGRICRYALQRCIRANWSYPPDDETAAICRVKALERATSPSGELFLAVFCGFNAILILFMSPW